MSTVNKLKRLGYTISINVEKENLYHEGDVTSCVFDVNLHHHDKDDSSMSVGVSGPKIKPLQEIITDGIDHYIDYLFFSKAEPKPKAPVKEIKPYLAKDVLDDFFETHSHYASLVELHKDYGQFEAITRANGWLGKYATKEEVEQANFKKLKSSFMGIMSDEVVKRVFTNHPDVAAQYLFGFAEQVTALDNWSA